MKRIFSFSAIVQDNNKIVGNCFVSYHYQKSNSDKWDVCYVNSVLYIENNQRLIKSQLWNESEAQDWITPKSGKLIVLESLKKEKGNSDNYKLEIYDENYILERNGKQIYVLKDYNQNIQHIQIMVNKKLNQEEKERISLSLDEIAEKYF